MRLRDYQTKAVDDCRNTLRRCDSVLLQAATGAGKTVIASDIMARAVGRDARVLFLAHRRELIEQTAAKLQNFGLAGETAILMSGHRVNYGSKIQVASVDTIRARCMTNKTLNLPHADLVIVDECHRSLAPTYVKLIEHYIESGAKAIGLTATPVRGDGRGLGSVWQSMVRCPDIGELMRQGHLVPCRYYAPSMPDLKGVKVARGDYVAAQLEGAMNKAPLIGDIVRHWFRLAKGRPTIVFASGVEHSRQICAQFRDAGVVAEHIDATTPAIERADIIGRLRAGKVDVISNCMVLTEGFDCPALSCCILARPTKSLGLYLQMVGRVLRTMEGKHDAILIDHSGSIYAHGFAGEDRDWRLEESENIQTKEKEKKEKESKPITCMECHYVYEGQRQCPQCGWEPKREQSDVEWVDGELQEVESPQERGLSKANQERKEKERFFRELLGYSDHKGYKRGWANYKFEEKYGHQPHTDFSRTGAEDWPAVKKYLAHRAIKRRAGNARQSG